MALFPQIYDRECGIPSISHPLVNDGRAWDPLIPRMGLDTLLRGHRGCVNHISFNKSGTLLCAGSDDMKLSVWDTATMKLRLLDGTGHLGNIFCSKFVPCTGDTTIATCAADGAVMVHNITTGHKQELHCHSKRAKKLLMEPDNPHVILSCSEDGTVHQFDQRSNCQLVLLYLQHFGVEQEINSISSPYHKPWLIALGASDDVLRVYDKRMMASGRARVRSAVKMKCVQRSRPSGARKEADCITGVCFADGGDEVLVNYLGEHIYLVPMEPREVSTQPVSATRTPPRRRSRTASPQRQRKQAQRDDSNQRGATTSLAPCDAKPPQQPEQLEHHVQQLQQHQQQQGRSDLAHAGNLSTAASCDQAMEDIHAAAAFSSLTVEPGAPPGDVSASKEGGTLASHDMLDVDGCGQRLGAGDAIGVLSCSIDAKPSESRTQHGMCTDSPDANGHGRMDVDTQLTATHEAGRCEDEGYLANNVRHHATTSKPAAVCCGDGAAASHISQLQEELVSSRAGGDLKVPNGRNGAILDAGNKPSCSSAPHGERIGPAVVVEAGVCDTPDDAPDEGGAVAGRIVPSCGERRGVQTAAGSDAAGRDAAGSDGDNGGDGCGLGRIMADDGLVGAGGVMARVLERVMDQDLEVLVEWLESNHSSVPRSLRRPLVEQLLEAAEDLLEADDPLAAMSFARSAVRLAPNLGLAHYQMSQCYEEMERYQDALHEAEVALQSAWSYGLQRMVTRLRRKIHRQQRRQETQQTQPGRRTREAHTQTRVDGQTQTDPGEGEGEGEGARTTQMVTSPTLREGQAGGIIQREGETVTATVGEGRAPGTTQREGERLAATPGEGEGPEPATMLREGETSAPTLGEGRAPVTLLGEGETPTTLGEGQAPAFTQGEGETFTAALGEGRTSATLLGGGETPTATIREGEVPGTRLVTGAAGTSPSGAAVAMEIGRDNNDEEAVTVPCASQQPTPCTAGSLAHKDSERTRNERAGRNAVGAENVGDNSVGDEGVDEDGSHDYNTCCNSTVATSSESQGDKTSDSHTSEHPDSGSSYQTGTSDDSDDAERGTEAMPRNMAGHEMALWRGREADRMADFMHRVFERELGVLLRRPLGATHSGGDNDVEEGGARALRVIRHGNRHPRLTRGSEGICMDDEGASSDEDEEEDEHSLSDEDGEDDDDEMAAYTSTSGATCPSSAGDDVVAGMCYPCHTYSSDSATDSESESESENESEIESLSGSMGDLRRVYSVPSESSSPSSGGSSEWETDNSAEGHGLSSSSGRGGEWEDMSEWEDDWSEMEHFDNYDWGEDGKEHEEKADGSGDTEELETRDRLGHLLMSGAMRPSPSPGPSLSPNPHWSVRYMGASNMQTVKDVSFIGPGQCYVASGSDCGRLFVWDRVTGRLLVALKADQRIVNCVQAHPSLPMLASCGIDSSIKMWTPTRRPGAWDPNKLASSIAMNEMQRHADHRRHDGPIVFSAMHAELLLSRYTQEGLSNFRKAHVD